MLKTNGKYEHGRIIKIIENIPTNVLDIFLRSCICLLKNHKIVLI